MSNILINNSASSNFVISYEEDKIDIFQTVTSQTSFNTCMITRKQQTLSRRKYEKSLHSHRFAKHHVRKHPSVFLKVIDSENISGAPTELYLRLRFQRTLYSAPQSRQEPSDEKRKKVKRSDVCVLGKGSTSYHRNSRVI